MQTEKLRYLQLFADGGAAAGAGEGSAAGDNGAVAAGQQPQTQADVLAALGVPPSKIRAKYKNTVINAPSVQEPAKQDAAVQTGSEPTQQTDNGGTAQQPQKMTWDEIKKDPEYNRQMQDMVQKRVQKYKQREDQLNGLLNIVAQRYGIDAADPEKLDINALTNAVSEDNEYYEKKGLELGISADLAKHIDDLERRAARADAMERENSEQRAIAEHLQKLEAQAEAFKAAVPDFDLRTELSDPTFARLTSPNVGLSVEDAYFAMHRQEIQQAQAQQARAAVQAAAAQTKAAVANSIQAGQRRPTENTATTQAGSVLSVNDPKNMTPQQRAELKARIRQAAAKGVILMPDGSFEQYGR